MNYPTFDVVITTYRRPDYVVLAVQSCLSQGTLLKRVIVVDDASNDDTEARISALNDPRILYVCRKENGGIGAARRDAFALSEAEWTITLDSDHELLPGAVDILAENAACLAPDIGILGARYIWDDGQITPKFIPMDPIDYQGRITWAEKPNSIGADYVCCIARWVREKVQWMAWRGGGTIDTLFHLDIASVSKAIFIDHCLGLQKSCADAGHTRGSAAKRIRRRHEDASDSLITCQTILQRHGYYLKQYGPATYSYILQRCCFFSMLLGHRVESFQYWQLARQAGFFPFGHAVGLLMGIIFSQYTFKTLYYLRDMNRQIDV